MKVIHDCPNCPAHGKLYCPTKPNREDYDNENQYLIDLECGVWSCKKTVLKLLEENRILKETLNCSKETCDNCGIITCENFQRQRKSEPCPMYISYKARIKNLEHENDVLTESYNNSEMNLQNCSRELADAKELIKEFLLMAKVEHLKDRYETVEEAEKFLEEIK